MKSYHTFMGIDIGKLTFVVALHGQPSTHEYDNTPEGIHLFLSEHESILSNAFCVLETTGGYELALLYTLCDQHIDVHRADTRKVKNFIRSFGNAAKTDALDSKALARYGMERQAILTLFKPSSNQAMTLFHLVHRREDLKHMLVAEKNRIKNPTCASLIKDSCTEVITLLTAQIETITQYIQALINEDSLLKAKQKKLMSIPGIGKIIAIELLILLPELGTLNRRQIASLVGVAPIARESGQFKGYRKTGHGRQSIKPLLFLAAMAARNSNSELKHFYERLSEKGKKKMVALTALMRKIIVITNAKLKTGDMVA
jgi:transposase